MALKAGKNAKLYMAGYDLSGYVNRFQVSLPRSLADVTTFNDSGKKWHPTLHDDSFRFDGFYDAASGAIEEIMETMRSATSVTVCSLLMGATQSDKVLSGEGVWQEEYPIEASVDGMVRMTGSFKFHDLARAGIVLLAKGTRSSNGNSAVVDDGASSSSGAEAYLHVFSCGADDDLIVKVQTDTTDAFSSPTDLITFTTATGQTSERKTVTGSVERYVRVNYSGTAPWEASFAVVWARL